MGDTGGTGIREQSNCTASSRCALATLHSTSKRGVNRATILNQFNQIIKRIGNQPGKILARVADRRNEI